MTDQEYYESVRAAPLPWADLPGVFKVLFAVANWVRNWHPGIWNHFVKLYGEKP